MLWNEPLADALGVPRAWSSDPNRCAQYFSGNALVPGSRPIALAYAGHQFGHFVPQLGDGRAHLLGELVDPSGQRFDVQLKGSGRSRFSRGGDGRCALGPALREYIMSEAMHALGVPTTRSLAVVTTGEIVHRETPRPGAIVTRIASSHIRVGTFEFFAARHDIDGLRRLADFAIARHDPDLLAEAPAPASPERYLAFFDRVVDRQIRLIVEWTRVGFIHGVMNTDNTAISGETIDFGPCAMMGIYDPRTVYSSIDVHGRYAFGNQARIAAWNLARLAECLIPIIDEDEKAAVRRLEPILATYASRIEAAEFRMYLKKFGLVSVIRADQNEANASEGDTHEAKTNAEEASRQDSDRLLVRDLLASFLSQRLDYTITFEKLRRCLNVSTELSTELRTVLDAKLSAELRDTLGETFERWRLRVGSSREHRRTAEASMQRANPVVIPRNHHVEAVLNACTASGETTEIERFLNVLRSPYDIKTTTPEYQDAPIDGDAEYQTFCGT